MTSISAGNRSLSVWRATEAAETERGFGVLQERDDWWGEKGLRRWGNFFLGEKKVGLAREENDVATWDKRGRKLGLNCNLKRL